MSSLSSEQLAAVRSLAAGKSQQQTAVALRITKRTVQRWTKIPEFTQAVRDGKDIALEATLKATADDIKAKIERLIPKAITVLETTLDDAKARGADRLRAADIVGKWAGLYQTPPKPESQQPAEETLKDYLAFLAAKNGNGTNSPNRSIL